MLDHRSPADGFTVEVSQPSPHELELRLRGDVCILAIGALRRALDAALDMDVRRLVIDLAEADIFGAAAVGELARAVTALQARGGTVRVRSAGRLHRVVLEVTGFGGLLDGQGPAAHAEADRLAAI